MFVGAAADSLSAMFNNSLYIGCLKDSVQCENAFAIIN